MSDSEDKDKVGLPLITSTDDSPVEPELARVSFSGPIARGSMILGTNIAGRAFRYGKTVGNVAMNKGINAAKNKVKSDANNIRSKIGQKPNLNTTLDSNGDGNANYNIDLGSYGVPSSGRGFTDKPPVKSLSLNTPIPAAVYQQDAIRYGDEGPKVFIQGCRLTIPDVNTGDFISQYLSQIIWPAFRAEAQENLGFNVNANTVFSDAKIRTYFNDVLLALQVYYSMWSIISFSSNYKQNNLGMEFLRDTIGTEEINLLNLLSEKLGRLVIPPNMDDLAFWISQTFKLDPVTSNSSVVKIIPTNLTNAGVEYWETVGWTGLIESIMSKFDSSDNQSIVEMLSRIVYKKGLPWISSTRVAPLDEPIYDSQFKNLWTNLDIRFYDGTGIAYGPIVTTTDEEFPFTTYSNELDGAVLGMIDRSIGANRLPGILEIYASADTNGHAFTRFYINDNLRRIVALDTSTSYSFGFSAGLSNVLDPSDLTSLRYYLPQGGAFTKQVSIDSCRMSTQYLIKWLLGLSK